MIRWDSTDQIVNKQLWDFFVFIYFFIVQLNVPSCFGLCAKNKKINKNKKLNSDLETT